MAAKKRSSRKKSRKVSNITRLKQTIFFTSDEVQILAEIQRPLIRKNTRNLTIKRRMKIEEFRNIYDSDPVKYGPPGSLNMMNSLLTHVASTEKQEISMNNIVHWLQTNPHIRRGFISYLPEDFSGEGIFTNDKNNARTTRRNSSGFKEIRIENVDKSPKIKKERLMEEPVTEENEAFGYEEDEAFGIMDEMETPQPPPEDLVIRLPNGEAPEEYDEAYYGAPDEIDMQDIEISQPLPEDLIDPIGLADTASTDANDDGSRDKIEIEIETSQPLPQDLIYPIGLADTASTDANDDGSRYEIEIEIETSQPLPEDLIDPIGLADTASTDANDDGSRDEIKIEIETSPPLSEDLIDPIGLSDTPSTDANDDGSQDEIEIEIETSQPPPEDLIDPIGLPKIPNDQRINSMIERFNFRCKLIEVLRNHCLYDPLCVHLVPIVNTMDFLFRATTYHQMPFFNTDISPEFIQQQNN